MKKLMITMCVASEAFLLFGCGAPATNTGNAANTANTNGNSKSTAAAPTKEALLELDKKANEAWMKGDTAHFEGMLSDKFIRYMNGTRSGKADEIKMIAGTKCDVKSWSLDEANMTRVSDDVYVNTYKSTFEGTCTFDGKSERIPSPMRAASVWVRNGDKWQGVYHKETPIIDPKALPPPAPVKKEGPKKDDKTASNSNTANAIPAPDANTAALLAVEKAVWEAWKDKDAKRLEDLTAKDLAFVNIFGTYFANKAATIKDWSEGTCEVKSVNVADGFVTSLSPAVSILTHKGTADGTCSGQKLDGVVYGTSVYLKDGASWKLAFTFNAPA